MRLSRLLRWFVLAMVGAAAAAGLSILLFPAWLGLADRLLHSCVVLAALGLASIGCAVPMERGKLTGLMRSGLLVAGVTAVTWMTLLWFPLAFDTEQRLAKGVGTTTVWVLLVMVIGLFMIPRMTLRAAVILRAVTMGLASLLAILVVALLWTRSGLGSPPLIGAISVAATLTGCALPMTLLLARFHELRSGRNPEPFRMALAVTCPRCNQRQMIRTGGDQCAACGLRITVSIP